MKFNIFLYFAAIDMTVTKIRQVPRNKLLGRLKCTLPSYRDWLHSKGGRFKCFAWRVLTMYTMSVGQIDFEMPVRVALSIEQVIYSNNIHESYCIDCTVKR